MLIMMRTNRSTVRWRHLRLAERLRPSLGVEVALRLKATPGRLGARILDKIDRDEDPLYVTHEVKGEVLSYFDQAKRDGLHLLDFGSGCGALSLVISRLANARITGVELEPTFIDVAKRGAELYMVEDRDKFSLSPDKVA